MSDITLHSAVMKALTENPLVHADEIAAEVRDGDVVLRGTVGSLVQKAEAGRTARDRAAEPVDLLLVASHPHARRTSAAATSDGCLHALLHDLGSLPGILR